LLSGEDGDASTLDPAAALAAIQAHRVTFFCGVPTMYQTLTASADLGKYDLISVRVCISALPHFPQKSSKIHAGHGGCWRKATA
jgi:acyl-coenzyme A synthetase/AMP-(fatty) acid ligase